MIVAPGTAVDTTGDPRWSPLRVTAVLAEPVVALTAGRLHLDGPLSWGAYLQHVTDCGHGSLPAMTADHCADFDLPLAVWTRPLPGGVHELACGADPGTVWGWATSAATPAGDVASTVVQVRRRPAVEAGHRYAPDARWHLSAGPQKARDVPHAAMWVRELHWWCLGDPDRLRLLLGRVPALGRLTRHGHGRVLSWTVDGDADALQRWQQRVWPDPDGRPDAIRAPYHHRSRRMPCTMPGAGAGAC